MTAEPKHEAKDSSVKLHDYIICNAMTRHGLYSQVRFAYQKKYRIPLAVKIISKKKIAELPKKDSIVFNETILAALIDHPNIIRVEEVVENKSCYFTFMQYAERGDLLHLLRKEHLAKDVGAKLVYQLLSAVEMIHSVGIVHRDIKPENILITSNGTLKLCDFGLASVTSDGVMTDNCGSIDFVAPEVMHSVKFDGFKADMWGVGAVIYTMFARRYPFDNVTHDFDYAAKMPDFSKLPKPFDDICRQLLSLDPSSRPYASEVRMMLGANTVRPILSGINVATIDLSNTSKLCQAIGMPLNEVVDDLRSEEMSELKVVGTLIQNRSLLKNVTKAVSAPTPTKPIVIDKKFKAEASEILASIKGFLIPMMFAISSPLSGSPEIVRQENDSQDTRITYFCTDDTDGYCTLELMPEEGSINVCKTIMRYLRERFPSLP